MKKRKKFDNGGSVMDKPSRDMRDPAYRRQLEREQALKTSTPELMLAGSAMGATPVIKKLLSKSKKPTESLTKNITIGQDVEKANKYGLPKELKDMASEAELLKKGLRGAVKGMGRLALDIPALESLRRSSFFNSQEGYKKGGTVKSASSRADGIAQRGKTKGRIC